MVYKMGERVSLPFLNMKLNLNSDRYSNEVGNIYFIKLNDIDQVVVNYQNVRTTALEGTSLIEVSMMGSNKSKMVNFLNTTVKELVEAELMNKTNFARNTKDFIDRQFEITSDSLKSIETDLGEYKKKNRIYNLSQEGIMIFEETIDLEKNKINLISRLEYLYNLEKYINTHNTYSDIPAPAIIEIEDNKIRNNIDELTQLYVEKLYWAGNVTSEHPSLKLLEDKIRTRRKILLENSKTLRSLISLS